MEYCGEFCPQVTFIEPEGDIVPLEGATAVIAYDWGVKFTLIF